MTWPVFMPPPASSAQELLVDPRSAVALMLNCTLAVTGQRLRILLGEIKRVGQPTTGEQPKGLLVDAIHSPHDTRRIRVASKAIKCRKQLLPMTHSFER